MTLSEKNLTHRIWLDYFNRYLYERGCITERERNLLHQKTVEKYREK